MLRSAFSHSMKKPMALALLVLLLAMAGLLWWWYSEEPKREARMLASLEVSDIDPSLALAAASADGIDVRFSGPKSILEALRNQRLVYSLNLSGLSAGVHRVTIDKDQLALPNQVTVLAVEPPAISVSLEKGLERTVPVSVAIGGGPPAGWELGEVKVTPETVSIWGPEKQVAVIEDIKTKPIDLGDMTGIIPQNLALDVPGWISATPSDGYTAEIEIIEQIVTRTYTGVFVTGRNQKHPYVITPGTITLEVKGPVRDLDKMTRDKGPEVYVDLRGLDPGVYARRAVIGLPVETTLVRATPEVFTVTIKSQQ